MTVVIAGGGVAGLALGLTLHEIGVPFVVLESVRGLRPLGVGINLQPNAVRELDDLGLLRALDGIGIPTEEWALAAPTGVEVYAEPRGLAAGYRWPQYSVHRGRLQMLLYETLVARAGPEVVLLGHRLLDVEQDRAGAVAVCERRRDGSTVRIDAELVIGADGLHSAVRRWMFPDEGPPVWGGGVLWRATSLGRPVRTGASFVLLGTMAQRFVHYPIERPDPATGLQLQNWIAELTFDPAQGWGRSDWNQRVDVDEFAPAFADWNVGWLDVPGLIAGAGEVFEYPMVDRDPVPTWVQGRVGLIGDAAHVMYPVGSNGASQAIVDARVLGKHLVAHGVGPAALDAFEAELLEPISALVLRNRGAGPIAILGEVERRCDGDFDHIDQVIPPAEVDEFMAGYKRAAGFAIDTLNLAPPTIEPGARAA